MIQIRRAVKIDTLLKFQCFPWVSLWLCGNRMVFFVWNADVWEKKKNLFILKFVITGYRSFYIYFFLLRDIDWRVDCCNRQFQCPLFHYYYLLFKNEFGERFWWEEICSWGSFNVRYANSMVSKVWLCCFFFLF